MPGQSIPPLRPLTLRDMLRQHAFPWPDYLDHDLLNREASDPIARTVARVINHAEGLRLEMAAGGLLFPLVEPMAAEVNRLHRRNS